MLDSWKAALLHMPTLSLAGVSDPAEATRMRLARIGAIDGMIGGALDGEKADLVLLPEFAVAYADDDLYGIADGDGPEMERLASIAQARGVILGAMLYVTDRRFPGRYFNASILFGENGDILARYYRLITNHASSPHDFWQRYLDVVGIDGAFPVAKTRLGTLAMMSSMEMMYPEIARTYMLRGAETLLHLTAFSSDRFTFMNRARAYENMMYLLSASGTVDAPAPSVIAASAVDWQGKPIGRAVPGQSHVSRATVDVGAMRTARATPLHDDYVNLLSRLRIEALYGHQGDISLFPMDRYAEGHAYGTKITPETDPAGIAIAIDNMRRAGLLPASDKP